MNPTHLILDNVTKQFGEQKAVNQVNLTLQAGECVGLAGHNGEAHLGADSPQRR